MRVNCIGSCGLVVAVSMSASLHVAQAGDRKGSAGVGIRSERRFSEFVTNSSSSSRRGGMGPFWVTNSDSKSSRSPVRLSLPPSRSFGVASRAGSSEHTRTKEKESAPTPAKERKKITLFRFNPKFGDISVQPVLGEVNGAQVCVEF